MSIAAGKSFRWTWVIGLLLVGGVAAFAWTRVGLLDLPSIPTDVTLAASGLDGLPAMKQLDDALYAEIPVESYQYSPAAAAVREGLVLIQKGKPDEGLERMRQGVTLDPKKLVLSNAYRMATFRLRRDYLMRQQSNPTVTFPAWLEKEPLAFLTKLDSEQPSRETKINLALAWVDMMLLFPALEIKAPSSVESVNILTKLIDGDDPYYVPALYGRGLNHLHRPARLVWPESAKTGRDAAVRDIARAIALGRKFGVGSAKLQATLAISLGDAYIKTGRYGMSRSWWQIAQNLSSDAAIQEAVRRRYDWKDEEMLDKLEEELDHARATLDSPMTDLKMVWE
jgi:tetratricopeptide (TPR) repeat protein